MVVIKKLIVILVILVSIFLAGCWTTPDPPEPNGVAYRGYAIGVGWYAHCNNLTAPPYNVDRMREIFDDCRFGEEEIEFLVIDELKDSDATKEAVLNGIASTFADADENDVSYFYWCGHGSVMGGMPVICPTDFNFTLQSSISVDELEIALSAIPGTKVVILEACHSGNFIDKNIGDFNDLVIEVFSQLGINKDTYQVITSCKGHQVCWQYGGIYTYFTQAVYEGCQNLTADVNEDGIINLTELHEYVIDWVEANCSKNQDTQMYPDGSTFPIVEY